MDDIFDLAANDECGTQHTFDNISQLAPSYSWLEMLNPEQKEAVKTTEGPVLVLSGAGTGKTKVLTTRLAYILSQHKANPWNCLVVTFTNRAAREMRERVQGLIGEIANSVWLGTFHSICVKILRNHAEMVGLKSNFTILNEDDQKRIIKQLLEADAIDDKKYPPQSILDRISRWKDKGLTTDKVSNESRENILVNIYKKYQERLLELNCVDFGDIILHTITILLSDKDVLEKYQNRFRYIMVDEYQDTNVSQYLLIRLLSQKYRNLCCVGDDDQSIYSWRGAEIENILRFNKDFPDARTIRLERNYRSTANILKAASNLISNNQDRLGKTLKVAEHSPAHQCENSKIKVISTYNGTEEAQYVVDEIENLTRQNYQYSDMAILVRTAAQTREFEEKLIHEAIPYQVIGGLKFYERAEIRDALAYFRVVLQPDDDLALERIINKPARGIGAKSVEKFRNEARLRHCSMYNAIKQMLNEGNISGKSKNALEQLINNFEDWRKASTALTPDDLAAQIIEDSGYFDMLKADKSVEAPGRIENLKELINSMDDKFSNLSEFMEHVSLVMDKDDITDNNKVMLITLHSAKGLEFNIVFLPGWEEGLFPHQRALDEGGTSALEEERRLAYVAITRARQKLYISMAHNRRVYGQWQNNLPSRFLNELPPSTIEICNKASSYFGSDNYGSSGRYNGGYNKNSYQSPSSATRYDDDDRYSYVSNDEYDNAWGNIYKAKQQAKNQHADYPLGTKVYHESWGIGKVVAIDGNKLGIIFENVGLKRILKDYVRKA